MKFICAKVFLGNNLFTFTLIVTSFWALFLNIVCMWTFFLIFSLNKKELKFFFDLISLKSLEYVWWCGSGSWIRTFFVYNLSLDLSFESSYSFFRFWFIFCSLDPGSQNVEAPKDLDNNEQPMYIFLLTQTLVNNISFN